MLSGYEIIIVLAVLVLFFGVKRLPEIGKGLGEGIRGFKDGLKKKEDLKLDAKLDEDDMN